MVSTVLASVLQSYLGQYLELTDSVISVGSEVRLSNVRLKESALSDLGLPVKCIHGKISKLVIKIPWFSLFTSPTSIEIDGLHLLVVPSTSVKYDEAKERELNHEAKLKRLQRAEDAKRIRETKTLLEEDKTKEKEVKDSFVERLGANILKNLEVIITRVHIRYEDDGRSTGGYPFAAGVTLERLNINTKSSESPKSSDKLKVFQKFVSLDSLALYWRPRANLYSVETIDRDEVVDVMFNSNIGTREKPIKKLKYLLGPISSSARLEWCLNPELYSFEKPQLDLSISMEELQLSLTKYQYYDFILLLQSFEFMSRASQFRKYKARYDLENLPHYRGRGRDLWNFAYDSIFEEKIMRRRRNWSWDHISTHTRNCKDYREAYKLKLRKGADNLKKQTLGAIEKYEYLLDEVNIRIQRQLAKNEVDEIFEEKRAAASKSSGGWFSGWFGSNKEEESDPSSSKSIQQGLELMNMQKLGQALSNEEKQKLYEVLDYQDDARYGIYPRSFVARKLNFFLDILRVTICDEDLNDAAVVTLELSTVKSSLVQRPSANNLKFIMGLEKLTIVGFNGVPLANTLKDSGLLNFEFENNPPAGDDLDNEGSSLYDQRVRLTSSTLEFIYDSSTLYHLMEVFKTSEELNLANLQHTAASYLSEYRQTSTLTLQYIVDHRNLIDINMCFNSCIVILPMHGKYSEDSPVAVANLGSIIIKTQPISTNLKKLSTKSSSDFNISELTETLRSQVYYKFDVSLENIQVLVSLGQRENWRKEISAESSPLFLLNPTSIHLKLEICVIKNDPELPLYKVGGNLKSISVTIADYRLIKLTQIIDTIIDAYKNTASASALKRSDSNESMVSALSSFANSGSLMSSFTSAPVSSPPDIIRPKLSDPKVSSVNMTDLLLNFNIQSVYLKISHLKHSAEEEEDIFYFRINDLDASAKFQCFATSGLFHVGGISCEHLLLTTPSNSPVKIIQTDTSSDSSKLFSLTYVDANKHSPAFAKEYASTLKSMDVIFNCVHIMVHQDALLDLVAKVTKLIDEVSSKATNIAAMGVDTGSSDYQKPPPRPRRGPSPTQHMRLSNQLSLKTTASIGLWALRAKKRSSSVDQGSEITELQVNAQFKSVSFDFMTSKIHLAHMRVNNLEASYVQRESDKIITAKLVDFTVSDGSSLTIYPHIIQSMDTKVFDAKIRLFNNITSEMKAQDPTLIDLQVSVQMGRIRLVFLMKFLNDFLSFLEPFSTAKEIVAEKANDALEEASKTFSNAYANAIRAQLDIKMEAPLIIIPVFSRSKTALSANLGTLSLHNRFKQDPRRHDIVYDEMFVQLKDLNLLRVKFREEDNQIISSTPIVKPITFELDLLRNMAGVRKVDDPPELTIQGTLYCVQAELSKGDYNVIMAVLLDNFSEKGSFATMGRATTDAGRRAKPLSLPLKKKNSSRSSLASSIGSFKSLHRIISTEAKHPDAYAVSFDFKFLGFEAEIFSNETTFEEPRPRREALAKIHLEHLSVSGFLKVDSSLIANVEIRDLILEDSRDFDEGGRPSGPNSRIVKLMEAKRGSDSGRSDNMIDVTYARDALGNSDIRVTIHSFRLVGSISYLLDIAYFFIPSEQSGYDPQSSSLPPKTRDQQSREVHAGANDGLVKMNFFLLMEEPDIFLVENILDEHSESLLLNMELQFKYTSTSDGAMSLVSSLTNIRCHTRPFRSPSGKVVLSSQILQPCTVSFSASQPLSHGMRVNANFSDLCLNVSPRSIRIIQNSVTAFLDSMKTQGGGSSNCPSDLRLSQSLTDGVSDIGELWKTLPYKEDQFWFLKPEERDFVEATEDLLMDVSSCIRTPDASFLNKDEQAIINVNNLIIKVGTDSAVVPSILIESSLECDVKNWSSDRMSAIGTIKLEVAYYNSKCALWEPVLEPIVQRSPNDMHPSYKRWDLNVTLQNNASNDFGSALISPSFDEADAFVSPEHMPPLSTISFVSREVLEISITKSFLKVLNDLSSELFTPVEEDDRHRALIQLKNQSSLVVQNRLGKDIEIQLKSKGFVYSVVKGPMGHQPQSPAAVVVPHNEDVYLDFNRTDKHDKAGKNIYVSPLREQKETSDASLRLYVEGERDRPFEIPFSKADQRFFPFKFRGSESGSIQNIGLVSSIKVEHGCKYVTLGSLVRFRNSYRLPVEIFISASAKSQSLKKLSVLSTDTVFHVPVSDLSSVNSVSFGFRISEPGGTIGVEFLYWKELLNGPVSKVIRCTNCHGEPDVFITLEGSSDSVYLEQSQKLSGVVYNVEIKPVLIFKNCLPLTLHYRVGDDDESSYIERGTIAHFRGLKYGETAVQFQIFEFREMDWSCSQVIPESMEELSLWKFESSGGDKQKLDLGVHSILHGGTRVISIYAPFWMINKTGRNLVYKGNNDAAGLIHHPAEWSDNPLMFSYSSRSFFGKSQCSVRVDNSNWSSPFTLDTVEDAGKITCKDVKTSSSRKSHAAVHHIGININLSKSSLTKIISFTPYYMLLNMAKDFSVELAEYDSNAASLEWILLEPQQCVPFWPKRSNGDVILRVAHTSEGTMPFTLCSIHSTLLSLDNKYGGLYAECRISSSETLLTISQYKKGFAPVRLINHSHSHMIQYSESGQRGLKYLCPGETCLFTWINPNGPRKLVWRVSEYSEEYSNSLECDGQGVIELNKGSLLEWVSFLDGMQRILLFSQDAGLCYQLARNLGEMERIDQEIDISIQGIGISLVHNDDVQAGFVNKELLYASISASDIVWEYRKSGKIRYKPLAHKYCHDLEKDFQIYMRERSIGYNVSHNRTIGPDLRVNYQEEVIYSPVEGRLRRQFQRGLWFQTRLSAHQRQFHAKINRFQIDNQLRECLFPVIFAPVPLPKSVMSESIPKPFMELSILEFLSSEHSELRQYKYFQSLVQECHIKIDQGMINALMDFFYDSGEENLDVKEFLIEDLKLATRGLKDFATLTVTQGHKDFYDYLHLSPLKVHVSFSLTSYNSTHRSNFISLLLQSFGVTITDTDDIIFRLAYFERRHTFFSSEDLLWEMTRHYKSQAIKQIYVLIFGLDVIGNPLGLVVGVTRSVEDLFYEPFQGAVEGPSEFAEGLGIGVRSVFSGVVGGAAGTVSKITGALGKGLASLTFDEKFQGKRRDAIKKRGRQNFGTSMARSSKGLIMGLVDGVTGVATKPIEGAMEDGVLGFFKGAAKGTIGVVARPVGGVIDFTSGAFDSVKRVTEVSQEIGRIRPARFLHPDGVVRYYDIKSAQWTKVLSDLNKGHYIKTDHYVYYEEHPTERDHGYLVTNRRILCILYKAVMGSWSISWEFCHRDLIGPPSVGMEEGTRWYLLLKNKEEAGSRSGILSLFSSGDKGKKMFIRSREVARQLARIIEELRVASANELTE